MANLLKLNEYISSWPGDSLRAFVDSHPWAVTSNAAQIVATLVAKLSRQDYAIAGGVAVHRSATIETGSVLKGPLLVGPRCFIASTAYLRDGNFLSSDCVLGPGVELKSSFVFEGTKIAHFNFVGDSIIGERVNFEAGSIVCNFRNERADQVTFVVVNGMRVPVAAAKFGALIGDDARIGANAVLSPGTVLARGAVVRRGEVVDQDAGMPAPSR